MTPSLATSVLYQPRRKRISSVSSSTGNDYRWYWFDQWWLMANNSLFPHANGDSGLTGGAGADSFTGNL